MASEALSPMKNKIYFFFYYIYCAARDLSRSTAYSPKTPPLPLTPPETHCAAIDVMPESPIYSPSPSPIRITRLALYFWSLN